MSATLMLRILALALAPPQLAAAPAAAAPAKAAAFAPTRFSVVVEGAGPDVILIPGLASPLAVWDGARAALGGKYRLHLVQLNGFGGTAPGVNASGTILAPTVEELHRYVVANRLEAPAVVGHSMGGLMGLMLARAHPESVGRLMIVDALPFIGALFGPTASVASVTPQAEAVRDMMVAAAARDKGGARTPVEIPFMSNTPAGNRQVAAWSATANQSVAGRAMYDAMTTDLRPELPRIRTPITILYPYSAKTLRAEQAKAIYDANYAGAPDARLVAVPESFHFIMLDQPAFFAAAVKTFLTERR